MSECMPRPGRAYTIQCDGRGTQFQEVQKRIREVWVTEEVQPRCMHVHQQQIEHVKYHCVLKEYLLPAETVFLKASLFVCHEIVQQQ